MKMRRLLLSFLFAGVGHVMLFVFAGLGEDALSPQLVSSDSISVTFTRPSMAKKTATNPKVQPLGIKEVTPLKKEVVTQLAQQEKPFSDAESMPQPAVIKSLSEKKFFPVQARAVESDQVQEEVESSRKPVVRSHNMVEVRNIQETEVSNSEAGNSVVEAKPLYRDNPKPLYPALAQRRGWQGTVILAVSVLADGKADHVRIYKSSDCLLLDKAAVTAVKMWRFLPGTKDGVPVKMEVLIPVHFSLTK